MPSIFTLLSQHHLCRLGHVCRMEDGHIPKDLRGSFRRFQIQRPPKTALQRHLQERPEECMNRHSLMGKRHGISELLESHQARPHRLPVGEESHLQVQLHRPGSNSPHLLPVHVRQRLPLLYWPTQSHEEVQRPDLTQPGAAIVSLDGSRPLKMMMNNYIFYNFHCLKQYFCLIFNNTSNSCTMKPIVIYLDHWVATCKEKIPGSEVHVFYI